MTEPKPPLSRARLTANRANAARSTGPKSPEGKARASRNALTHGLCASVVAVPDEDPTLLAQRLEAWRPELNPGGSAAGDYLVLVAARKSVRLDRCHAVHEAVAARLARDATKDRLDARMVEVEALVRLLATDPDLAVRRLKLTPEGCDALLTEWRLVEAPLAPPAQWDAEDAARAARLLGLYSASRGQAPDPLLIPTAQIVAHREVAVKLKHNECPEKCGWKLRYDSAAVHEYDQAQVGGLAERAEAAVAEVRGRMAVEVAWLVARKAELVESERPEAEEATYRSRFDASERGKLLHRYEAEAERGLYRAIKEARDLNKGGPGRTKDDAGPPAEAAPASRNGPTAVAPSPAAEAPAGAPPAPGSPPRRRRDVRQGRTDQRE